MDDGIISRVIFRDDGVHLVLANHRLSLASCWRFRLFLPTVGPLALEMTLPDVPPFSAFI